MRTRLRIAATAGVAVALIAGASLPAQVVHTGTRTTTTTRTSTAGGTVATPAPVAAAAPVRIAGIAQPQTFIVVAGDHFVVPNGSTVIFANIPAFVLTDGRVFSNFGRGIEQIITPCGGVVNTTGGLFQTTGQPVVSQPVVVQPTPGATQPLPFTPAVPNQPTISQQMIAQALSTGPIIVNASSCWAANQVGQVFVTRP
jgi:hypothetical protein